MAESALVTDGLWRKSLSAIRSLGKAGLDVAVMGDSRFTTGFWSRYTRERIIAPTAANDHEGFGHALLSALRRKPGRILFPMEDASLMWVSEHRDEILSLARTLLPPEESLRIAQDKGATLEIARQLGLPCPRSFESKDADEFAKHVGALEPGSFVVKPRSGSGSAGVAYGEYQPTEAWKKHWERFGPMLIQERVPPQGRGRGVSLLFDRNGECVAEFAHERIQQYPNSGGPSTDRQSVHAPELVQWSIQLLKRLSWQGIAMVEWKEDPRDGQPKLMEINPRFWGSLELACRSGVDFPALFARAASGESAGPPPTYPAGVRCRWMIPGEILRYLTQPRAERESLCRFMKGLPGLAEEWDPQDLQGAIATIVCTGAYAINPRYWKYLRRG
ncbi:MAG: ATP-grasp domain-containing protein [Oligoflexia bacterium]|nr:ATP-grasp domain-containing protein [Oligoflexia bacterium]